MPLLHLTGHVSHLGPRTRLQRVIDAEAPPKQVIPVGGLTVSRLTSHMTSTGGGTFSARRAAELHPVAPAPSRVTAGTVPMAQHPCCALWRTWENRDMSPSDRPKHFAIQREARKPYSSPRMHALTNPQGRLRVLVLVVRVLQLQPVVLAAAEK